MNIRVMTGALFLASIGLVGCVGTRVHFEDVPLDKVDLSRGHKVTAEASGFHLFEVIPLGVNGRQARAYERMKNEAPFEYLTDIKVQDSWLWIWIGIKYSTTMSATAYPLKTTVLPYSPSSPSPTTQSLAQKLEEIKSLHDKGVLTDAEYDIARKKILGI